MKLINALSFIFILFANLCFSQGHKFMSYPHFDEADLKKTNSLIEKNAPAEILYNSVSYVVAPSGWFLVTKKFFSKIKIYDKKNAEEWLNIEIPVSDNESLADFQLTVYNYQNGKVEKMIINKKDQLKENLVKGIKIYKLAIPNILDGSVIEYNYKLENNNIFNLTYYLQYNIPVVYQEYNFEYPVLMSYIFNNTGTNILKPKYSVNKNEDHFGGGFEVFRFGYENTPSVPKELFVKDNERYRARVKPELTKYSTKYFSYDSAESWSKVADRLNNNDEFGAYLKNNVKDILPDNIKTFYDPLERANKIFDFVKNNYKWNKKDGIITSQKLRQLIKTKSGSAADINLLLVILLRDAGLQANPLLISTVDNGILNIFSPNPGNLNMVLASVKINNQLYFYDATSFASKVNMLPRRDWNDFGILIEGTKGTDLSFSNTNISKKDLIIKANLDIENSEITGTLTQKENGLYAIESYDEFDENKDKYNQSFKTEFNTNMKDVETKLLDNGDFESQMKFSSNSLMDIVGNKIILNPLLFLNIGNENFDQKEERKNQIDFISAFTREKKVEIIIPNGYKVGDLPKPKKIITDDKQLAYTYKVEFESNKLFVVSKVEVASQNYPKEYYTFFKQIWRIITESENQVISLVKI
ncbi:transglutaminase domain-containing protein [Chryseobacterium lineare]